MNDDQAPVETDAIRTLLRVYESGLVGFSSVPHLSIIDYLMTARRIVLWELSVIFSLAAAPFFVFGLLYWLIARWGFDRQQSLLSYRLFAALMGLPRAAFVPLKCIWQGKFTLRIIRVRYPVKWLYYLWIRRSAVQMKDRLATLRLRAFYRDPSDSNDSYSLRLEACDRRVDDLVAKIKPKRHLLSILAFALSTLGPASVVKYGLTFVSQQSHIRFTGGISFGFIVQFVKENLPLTIDAEFLVAFVLGGVISVVVDTRSVMESAGIYELENRSRIFVRSARVRETPWDLIALCAGSVFLFFVELVKYQLIWPRDSSNLVACGVTACLGAIMIWRRRKYHSDRKQEAVRVGTANS